MFKEGQIYKIKVELSPDLMGFGRAKVLSVEGQQIFIQLKSSGGEKLSVPRGTRIWFVGDSLNNRFNGLWTSEVKGSKIIKGVSALECKFPKFLEHSQRRASARAVLRVPIELVGEEWKDIGQKAITRNISRSGLGFSVVDDMTSRFTPGQSLDTVLQVGEMKIALCAKVIIARYNWLSNLTDVGVELHQLTVESSASLDRVLVWLGSRPRNDKAALSESGSLSRWMKTKKDDRRFVNNTNNTSSTSTTSTSSSSSSEVKEEMVTAPSDSSLSGVEADDNSDTDNLQEADIGDLIGDDADLLTQINEFDEFDDADGTEVEAEQSSEITNESVKDDNRQQ